jgi:hypothetical protein
MQMNYIRDMGPTYKGVVTSNDVVLAQSREKNPEFLTVTSAKNDLALHR